MSSKQSTIFLSEVYAFPRKRGTLLTDYKLNLDMKEDTFQSYVDMTDINNSMELDSGIEVARLTRTTQKGVLVATLEIRGDVRVYYKDGTYRCASQMPEELLAMLHDWKPEYSESVNVVNNNWPEVFLWTKEGDELVWTGESDVADAEGMTAAEIERLLSDYIDECLAS